MHPAEYDPIQFGHLERPDDQEDDELRCDHCGARLDEEPCTCGPAGPKIDSVWTGENGRQDRSSDAEESIVADDALGYPADWPKCPGCGKPALDGHRTCGNFFCGPERP